MQLTCNHCTMIFTTHELDTEKCIADVSNQFSKHFQHSHPAEARHMAQELANLNMVAVWLVMVAKHSTLLDQPSEVNINNPIMDRFSEVVEKIEDILGIEVFDNKPEVQSPEKATNLGEGLGLEETVLRVVK